MNREQQGNKGIFIASAAVILVLVFLLVVFTSTSTSGSPNGIILPDPAQRHPDAETPPQSSAGEYVQVTNENVLQILKTIHRETAYYQVCSVKVGSDEFASYRVVSLWVNGSLLHAEITDGNRTKSVLTDGQTIYLWYAGDTEPAVVQRSEGVTLDDLLGMLTYESLIARTASDILAAEYLQDFADVPCIYVECMEREDLTGRYWIDVNSGLLYQAEVTSFGEQMYAMKQNDLKLLASDDALFSGKFLLPDGTRPFTAAE